VAGTALAILGALSAYAVFEFSVASREMQEWQLRRSREEFERQFVVLKAGHSNRVYFYETCDTDALVRQLEGRPDVHELEFEMTDVTAVGLQTLTTLPNLRRLILYAGRGVDDVVDPIFWARKGPIYCEDLAV
jgi:hypothetical protein